MDALALGVVGAGGFASFVCDAIRDLEGIQVVAVCDTNPGAARRFAEPRGLRWATGVSELVADDSLSAVIVATPPSSHADVSGAALDAGLHVFCEKPLALSTADARRVRDAAERAGRVVAVDHVIRYNPLVQALARWRSEGVIGAVQRFAFENDAGDSALDPDHWFWRSEASGGILLEHGVHFFDVAGLLIGSPAERIQAVAQRRADGRADTVVATALHAGGAIATHAHGFSHPDDAERQLMRVDFGLTEARLEGWIPLRLTLEGFVDDAGLAQLRGCVADPVGWLALPGFRPGPRLRASLSVHADAAPQPLRSRDVLHVAPHRVRLEAQLGDPDDKQAVYAESVRAAVADFAAAIRIGRPPLAGVPQGAAAVAVAEAGTRAILSGATEPVPAV